MFSKMTNKELGYYFTLLQDSDNKIWNKELIRLYNDFYFDIYWEGLNFLPIECLDSMSILLKQEMTKRFEEMSI